MTAHARAVETWQSSPTTELGPELCWALDAASRTPFSLASLWSDLVSNRWKIVGCSFFNRRCLLTLKSARGSRPDRRLALRKVRVLERILLGEGQKALALTMKVAPSTVTLMSGECLRAMGLDCRTSRVPMPLVMAVHAAKNCTDYREGTLSELALGGVAHRIVGVPLPEARFDALSPAEREVARLLVEGRRHVEIARARDTSTRTIANQLAAAFHKLNVSGRAELLCRLIRRPESEIEGGVADELAKAPAAKPARYCERSARSASLSRSLNLVQRPAELVCAGR